jgi:hypothetical protein
MNKGPSHIVDLPQGSDLIQLSREKKTNLTCKYVVIKCAEEERLIFGPVVRFPYHANLVDKFCDMFEVAGGWEKQPDSFVIYDFNCNVVGGGWLEYCADLGAIRLYGASSAYGRFDHASAEQMLKQDPRFSVFTYEVVD